MKKILLFTAAALLFTAKAMAQQAENLEQHSKYLYKVLDYSPAPGQFVNTLPEYKTGDDAQKMAQKCTEALANNKGNMVTLGAFGGSITFKFDHSIANIEGEKDFLILGNAFTNSSEPGIVMVSKDVNKNGIADDPWYELEGSIETEKPGEAVYGYEVTYTATPMQDIPWVDNKGGSGKVLRNTYHAQEYFPLWMGTELKVKGTLLPKNATKSGTFYYLHNFQYGYVDNLPNSDLNGNSFDIAWAVDEARNKVKLDFIDFVKVYCAEQQDAGWLGETSTEVAGAEDLHLEASMNAIAKAQEARTATFDDVNVTLTADGYYNGDTNGEKYTNAYGGETYKCQYISGSYRFTVNNTPAWLSWSDFAISNRTATVFKTLTPDQFNSCVGHGYNNSANYVTAYIFEQSAAVEVLNKPQGDVVRGVYITNAAYTLNAILHGDNMSKGSTGKAEFETGDWLKLTITGKRSDNSTSTVDVYLADYRSSNPAEHYYLGDWQWVDLTSLGEVKSLSFTITGSRNNAYGLTTPSYFCMDNLNGTDDGRNGKVTGIIPTANDTAAKVEVARFTVDGKRISAPIKGINIVKYADGTVRKVIVR